MKNFNKNSKGIYIHIPFCLNKCPYCDFYSVNLNEELLKKYTDALCFEIHKTANELKQKKSTLKNIVDSIYFGGGTPNLIGLKNLEKITKTIYNNFILSPSSEITIELNPSCHNDINFYDLKSIGFNRLSIGMQSINDYELSILGRNHSSFDIKQILSKARKSGFNNISFDIMTALPNQNKSDLIKSLEFCVNNDIPHISAYLLKIEKGTKYFKIKDSLILPSEDIEAELYLITNEYLISKGYEHYEISNFCKFGMESRHNLKYWNCDEYIGFGPSAHSFIDGKRYYYRRSINEFINNPIKIYDGIGGNSQEYCMLRLRLKHGLENKEYKKRFGSNIPEIYYQRADKYVNSGFVKIDESGIKLTPKGFLLSNSLILNIIY